MPPLPKADPWLPYRKPRPGARTRLFCFPHAGASASTYRGFQEALPADVEVCAVQLPGREGRLGEEPVASMERLVPMIADGLTPHLGVPFALFGHSMGAAVAFELSRELRRRSATAPVHLFASGCPAPHIPDLDGTHALPDEGILARMGALGGMSPEMLQHRELMEMLLPIFRADAAITESRVHADEEPLDVPITAFGGLGDDKAPRADLEAWSPHTRGAFAVEMFPGDHFFVQSARPAVIAAVARALSRP
jgi:medium-chain acyl-[acyl-carrier-protein] hydrolase